MPLNCTLENYENGKFYVMYIFTTIKVKEVGGEKENFFEERKRKGGLS